VPYENNSIAVVVIFRAGVNEGPVPQIYIASIPGALH